MQLSNWTNRTLKSLLIGQEELFEKVFDAGFLNDVVESGVIREGVIHLIDGEIEVESSEDFMALYESYQSEIKQAILDTPDDYSLSGLFLVSVNLAALNLAVEVMPEAKTQLQSQSDEKYYLLDFYRKHKAEIKEAILSIVDNDRDYGMARLKVDFAARYLAGKLAIEKRRLKLVE